MLHFCYEILTNKESKILLCYRQTWLDIYFHKKANLSGLLICHHTFWTAYLQLLLFISECLNKYMHKMEKNCKISSIMSDSRRANLPGDGLTMLGTGSYDSFELGCVQCIRAGL